MKLQYLLIAVLASLLSISCMVSSEIAPSTVQLSSRTERIDIQSSGIAVLPPVEEEVLSPWIPYGNGLGKQLQHKALYLVSWETSRDLMFTKKGWDEYVNVMEIYHQTGEISPENLKWLSKTLGVNYIMLSQTSTPITVKKHKNDFVTSSVVNILANSSTPSESRTPINDVPGGSGYQTKLELLDLHAEVWDATSGEMVWKGFANAETLTSLYRYSSESKEETIDKLAQAIVDQLAMY